MIIGVPKEIKNNENRVGMTPAGVAELVKKGHTVYVLSSPTRLLRQGSFLHGSRCF